MEKLIQLIQTLRGKNGCPWDHKQTPASIAVYLMEEAYEVLEAVEYGETYHVCEELGDVLFQVLFITEFYREKGLFNIDDVTAGINEKMIRRHPHVFGNATVKDADEVKKRWNEIKMSEKNNQHEQAVESQSNVDRQAIDRLIQKAEESLKELKSTLNKQSPYNSLSIIGEILFSIINIERLCAKNLSNLPIGNKKPA